MKQRTRIYYMTGQKAIIWDTNASSDGSVTRIISFNCTTNYSPILTGVETMIPFPVVAAAVTPAIIIST